MSVPQNGPKASGPAPVPRPARTPRPMPTLKDWDFWRFLVSALGLLWDIVKTTFLK
jgi:hypothetical protein